MAADSIFVHLPGASMEKAFEVGNEISATVTGFLPSPMKLNFEKVRMAVFRLSKKAVYVSNFLFMALKVFLPCILETKKRYVGFSFESIKQKEAKFDAKGPTAANNLN